MKRKILLTLALISLISVGVGYAIIKYTYSQGQRAGRLVKILQKGFLLKTYEGTLDLGSGDKLTWDFSVHDSDLGKKLESASGKMVKLEYKEMLFPLFYTTKYNVVDFKLSDTDGNNENFCRLVNVLRRNSNTVSTVRQLIMDYDPSLLGEIRKCQALQ